MESAGTKEPARDTKMLSFRLLPSYVYIICGFGGRRGWKCWVFLVFFSQTAEAFKFDTLKRGHWFPLKLDLIIVLYVVISRVESCFSLWTAGFSQALFCCWQTLNFFGIGQNDENRCVKFLFLNEVILKLQDVNDLSCISVQLAFSFPMRVWYLLKYFCFPAWWLEGAKNWFYASSLITAVSILWLFTCLWIASAVSKRC